ncbi:hypothetical protein K493DRAFT_360355 [Basidiobolus meristosporus CBS 931.73]|uniref:Transforming acidic coiled-coil-containing protein C-terminal domain-containing protein n=1 Tax=Basidiobolus meristosporus CBS 931.73 TaxID=1314790 RepID=A0A1Y1XIN1_9FUNG|nr:hypothetical protein K493DRAFT_360355 [Basidiobolus meristosporus CBS 931.73]|eukprot:ORX85621.1 hypothetical protein K493DRAFT_360355 [Basidiobolus meristosporus CBS 931.73]
MLIGGKRTSSDEPSDSRQTPGVEGLPSSSKRQKILSPVVRGTPTPSRASDNWLISWDTPSTKNTDSSVHRANGSTRGCLLDSSDVFGPEDEPAYTEYEVEQLKINFEEQLQQELEYLRAELEEATRVREDFEDRMIRATEEADIIREEILSIAGGEDDSGIEADEALEQEIDSLERELKRRDQDAELWDQEILAQAEEERKIQDMVHEQASLRQALELEMSDKKEKYEADLTLSTMEIDVLKESFQDTQAETARIRKVFAQLKERYDKLKKVYESTRRNEENLANTIRRLQQDVQTSEERVSILKTYRGQLSGEADMRIAQERSKYQSDIMDYKARLQATLEEAIQMKDGFDNLISQLSLINENVDDDEELDMSQSYTQ